MTQRTTQSPKLAVVDCGSAGTGAGAVEVSPGFVSALAARSCVAAKPSSVAALATTTSAAAFPLPVLLTTRP